MMSDNAFLRFKHHHTLRIWLVWRDSDSRIVREKKVLHVSPRYQK